MSDQHEERLEQNHQISYLRSDIANIDYEDIDRDNNWSHSNGSKSILHQKQLYPSEFYVYEVIKTLLIFLSYL